MNRGRLGTMFLGLGLSLVLVLAAGCAASRWYHRAQAAMQRRDYDRAVEYYRRALERDPDNLKYRTMYRRARLAAAAFHFQRAEQILQMRPNDIEALEAAVLEYQLTINYDPTHQFAAARLKNALRRLERLRKEKFQKSSELERIKKKVERAQLLRKALNPRSEELIDVKWENASLKKILDSMGKMAGINVVYDRDFRDDTFSIELHGVTFREALEQILSANNLFFKIINENTIMIIPDTPNKRRQHEELVVKTFYLSNADVNEVIQMIRQIAQIQRVTPNTQLNAITVKDTPEKVALAERVIQMIDKEKAEVLLDIEILEVNQQTLSRYGIDISPGLEITQSVDVGQGTGIIFGHQLKAIDAASWSFQLPSLVYRAIRSDSQTRILAKPQVRASDGEQVSIRLGNRVPIPVQTFQSIIGTTEQAGLVAPITQFQLTDVGINVDITPRVHHNREVTLQMRFELSSIAAPSPRPDVPPTLGNRTINTTIRLKDGETNLLAGLIRQDERRSLRGIPGIEKIPILREIFAANEQAIEKTDVIFTITPHIIRMPNITEEDLLPVWIGTEVRPQIRKPPVVTPFEAPTELEPAQRLSVRPRSLLPELAFEPAPAGTRRPAPQTVAGEPFEGVQLVWTVAYPEEQRVHGVLQASGMETGDRVDIEFHWPVKVYGRPREIGPVDPNRITDWSITPTPEGFRVRFRIAAAGPVTRLMKLDWPLPVQRERLPISLAIRIERETGVLKWNQDFLLPLVPPRAEETRLSFFSGGR